MRIQVISFLILFKIGFLLFCLCSCEQAANEPDPDRSLADSAPEVVPILDCRPSDRDGQGSAILTPSSPVPAGAVARFEVTFTVGGEGIATGGFILFQVSPWWGWSEPQTLSADAPGYTQVIPSFDDPSLEIRILPLSRVLVFSREGALRPGDRIVFRYGPARVDRYAEKEELFQIFVDGDGDGHYACIENPPRIEIAPHDPVRLAVNSPPQTTPGQAVTVTVAALDAGGNRCELAPGDYDLSIDGPGDPLQIDPVTRPTGGEDPLRFDVQLDREGVFFFEAQGPGGVTGRSNVLFCRQGTPTLNLYFGDIHGHTRLSDGTGTPEDYLAFARDVSGLDIAAVTDHSDYGTIPLKGAVWQRIKDATNRAYEPGRFVTFLGFEWTNWVYGHRNVYYRDGDGPVFRSIDAGSQTPQELWRLLESFEAMTVAHHVGGGPIGTDWSIPPGSKEWLVEICSVHGNSEYYGGEACIYHPMKGAFVRDALSRGYHLGIIASGDTHDGHPGMRSAGAVVNGLVGVFATELTREAVWEAFRRRQVYGTSGPKIILFFRVADSPMGSRISWPEDKGSIPIAVQAVACDEIARIEVVRNGETAYAQEGSGPFLQALVEDQDPPEGEVWYYAKVVQKDGNMAWSSPVWVDRR